MKNITQSLKVIALALVLSFGLSYVYAWTAPTVTPPGGNVSAPINTSGATQLKDGAFGVTGIIHGYSNAYFDGNVGIGTTAPSDKLQVVGNEQMPRTSYVGSSAGGSISIGTSGGAQVGFIQSGTDDILQFFTHHSGVSHAPRMTIDRDGNVGIGTAAPAQKLSVAGTIESTSGGIKFPDATVQTKAANGAGAITGGCSFGTGWGTASGCAVQSLMGMTCSGGATARVMAYCSLTGACVAPDVATLWYGLPSPAYPSGFCIKN